LESDGAALANHLENLSNKERLDFVADLPIGSQVRLLKVIGPVQGWQVLGAMQVPGTISPNRFVEILRDPNLSIDVAAGLLSNAFADSQFEKKKPSLCRLLCQNLDRLVELSEGMGKVSLNSMSKYTSPPVLANLLSNLSEQKRKDLIESMSSSRLLPVTEYLYGNGQQQQIEQIWGMLPKEKRDQVYEDADQDQQPQLLAFLSNLSLSQEDKDRAMAKPE
jgi:Mg/Co/Ni transporter MgtE